VKLSEFKVGDKVYVPTAVRNEYDARYSTIDYIGERYVIVRSEFGGEILLNAFDERFSYWSVPAAIEGLEQKMRRLMSAGDALMESIQRAAWDNELTGPTMRMRDAIQNWLETR
jgi:hypothetical protein